MIGTMSHSRDHHIGQFTSYYQAQIMSHPLNVEICKVINEEEPTAGQEKQGLAVEDDLFHRKVEIQFGLGYV